MACERLSFGASKFASAQFEDGTIFSAQKVETKRPIPLRTAKHEAAHVVASGEIIEATIIPSGDALGTTQPKKMTAAAAAAAEAMGHSGTGHDMMLVKHYLGVSPEVAISAAKSALQGKEEEMKEVATLLEERRTIGQRDVEEARENVKNRAQGIFPIQIEIITADGNKKQIETKSYKGEIKISDFFVPQTQAA